MFACLVFKHWHSQGLEKMSEQKERRAFRAMNELGMGLEPCPVTENKVQIEDEVLQGTNLQLTSLH